jgi:CRP-like cAMP-binding protein/anti-anti-sigma regulatory factor
LFGHEIASKRVRPTGDVAILRETGPRRVVLQLEGVLFFGNADRLAHQVKHLFGRANTVVLDFKRVSDIDVSGATVLRNLVQRSREGGKHLVFCNVPAAQTSVIQSIFGHTAPAEPPVLLDLDTTLEYVEERALAEHAHRRAGVDLLSLHEIDFLHGLSADELANLEKAMTLREFAAGEILCHEGDAGDRMWLLLKGSVSVRLNVNDQRRSLRIASLARGTTVGEMSLIEAARRSATIVADEPVVCCELERSHFDALRHTQPEIAAKLLANLARELARRLRRTSEDLRPDR